MALRNQPYIPLYVQDYLTDEKLNMCSLSSQGVYIKLMCIMHKSEKYGTILLKQKDKQNESTCLNFAYKFAKLLPISINDLELAIQELIEEDVLSVSGDELYQKRMVKDNEISNKRAEAGKKGGETTQFAKAKVKANTESEDEVVNEDVNSKILCAEFVYMKQSEINKLKDDHGKDNFNTFVSILDNYKGSSGNKYKSDYRAILSWVIERAKKDGKYKGNKSLSA